MSFVAILSEFGGYLKLLQRLTGNKKSMAVNYFKVDENVDLSFKKYLSEFGDALDVSPIEYLHFNEFKEIFYQNYLNSFDDYFDMVYWDVVEYFGALTTIVDGEVGWNYLIEHGFGLVRVKSKGCLNELFLIVEYGDICVFMSVCCK